MYARTFHDLPLPRWAHVPGTRTSPDQEVLEYARLLIPTRYQGFVPGSDPAVRYGLILNDGGFFWESHEILEAVWKVAPQGGRDRILLRACIQIANANLKVKMERPRAVRRLLLDASIELDEVSAREGKEPSLDFAGSFLVADLQLLLRERLRGNQTKTDPIVLGDMHQNA